MRARRVAVVVLILGLGLGLGLALGCGPAPGSSPRPLLRIASDATFAPFHFVDDSGTATGFEIELARLAAERAGFRAEVLVVPYDRLLSGLSRGEHDLVAATTGITEERSRTYRFTIPHFRTCQAALVRAGAGEPEGVPDLSGRRVGAAGAGTSALALELLPQSVRVLLPKGQEGVPSLLEGGIDALLVDEFDAVEAARASEGRLRVLSDPVALESYAFVLASGRDEIVRALDRALSELEREGAIRELEARFGVARDADWPVRVND
jgi:ABC-type amino acid transport substrate-binding protein